MPLRDREAHLRFLATTGAALLEVSVDHRRALERIVELVVPELADYATLREVLEDGSLERLAVRHADPSKAGLVARLEAYQSSRPPVALLEVVATGRSRLAPEIPRQGLLEAAQDEHHLRLLEELDARSAMMVPIPARGRIVAVLSLVTAESGRTLGEADLLLAEDLARRAGLAIDNARLYEAEQRSRAEAEAARAEAEATRAALSLLVDASSLLSNSLNYEQGLVRLARLAASSICDLCLVDILDPGGTPRRVAAELADLSHQDLALVLLRRYAPVAGSSHPAVRVMATGRPEFSPEMGDEFMRETTEDAEHLRITQKLGFLSYMCIPLEARGRVLGALTLVATVFSNRRYTDGDLSLAQDLARRASLMLDNARLFEERSRIASILQQSLLPPELPQVPGADLAGRYLPAIGDIGGDFYDVFALGGGRWLLAVGDVCGKGPDAAWLTSMARYTLRAAAMQEATPAAMLRVVNAAILRQAPRLQFCTMACAVLDVSDGTARLTMALAGHPHPLLRPPDAAVTRIGIEGDLLGVLPEARYRDQTIDLAQGATVAFFSDGALAESAGTSDEDRLLAGALAAAGGGDAESTATALEAAALQVHADRPADDLLLLVLTMRPRPCR